MDGFKHAFGICSLNLNIVGLWPNIQNPNHEGIIKFSIFIITIFIIITFITLAQSIKLIMIWGNLYLMINNLSTANLPITAAVLKTILFRNHKTEVARLVSDVINDWKTLTTENEAQNMLKNAYTSKKISYICICLGMCSVHGHLMVRISEEMDIIPGLTGKREPMLISYFPYNYKTSPAYEITWFFQYTAAILATLIYSGIHCLFVGLVLHLRGQVANFRWRLESLTTDDNLKKNIGFIVERHESLNRFAKDMENIFNGMFLAEIICCTVEICLQLFLLVSFISNEDEESFPILPVIFMVIYLMHIGTHIYIFCFVGDSLRDESLSICDSAYALKWYDLSPQNSKLLLPIFLRAKKPLEMTAGKFCAFSLQLFMQILKKSGAILTMLLAVKERL